MDKKFLKFIPKFLLFSLPFSLLILSYFVLDPFRVLRKHEHYGSNFLKFSNRNVVSTSTYLYYNKDYHFKSFVFGSSRSSGFLTSDWKKHINDPNPFHFDAFNENISGIHSKMDFIKAQGGHLENVLIVLDIDSFSERFEEMGSLPHLRDPRWEGGPMLTNRNWWEFQLKFFKAYFKDYFLIKFLDARIFHTYRPWFEGAFSKHEGYYFDSPNNDFTFPMHVVEIKKDSLSYYHDPKQFKSVKKVKPHDMLIKKHHLPHLLAISKLLKSENTNYKIIIGPTYEWSLYNPVDLEILAIYFGKENIYNYAGKNKYTEHSGDYYDDSHYKPSVGRAIMNEIYRP